MRIRAVEYQDHVFGFKDGDYVMSYVTQTELPIRVLRLEAEDGTVGWGEIVRKPTIDPSTVDHRERAVLDSLSGKPIFEIDAELAELRATFELRGLAFGLETAYLDWLARRAVVPLYGLLGGRKVDTVSEYYSLSCGGAEGLDETVKSNARGWAVVQIKLGVGGPDVDRLRLRALAASLSAEQLILADFNGALTPDQAVEFIAGFDDSRIIWEEPCDTVEANTEVAKRSNARVMFDQCLSSLDKFFDVITERAAHSLVLKPAFLGGLSNARVARDWCVAAGLPIRVDGPWCGHVATAAALHLAVGVPESLLIGGCDLRQPLRLNEDWGGTVHLDGHRIAPSDDPGHGAAPH
ncbi:MAG: hypothetical protein CMO26_01200 [Thiotrichales bacterium]|nr:hypothetical protein [Thiotrichales bacterium]